MSIFSERNSPLSTPILTAWTSFEKKIIQRQNLPPSVVAFLKDVFFSGAFSSFQTCINAAKNDESPEAMQKLEELGQELDDFLQSKMQNMVLALLKGEKNEH